MRPRVLGYIGLSVLSSLSVLSGCGGGGGGTTTASRERVEGQTEFESAPPAGQSVGGGSSSGGAESASAGNAAPAANDKAAGAASTTPRTVEETDLYRVEGDRLYYLNSYRGLMVFDVSNVDAPKLIGRAPMYGTPVEMLVRNGVATVVVGDWYGANDDGTPFHGSIVRSYDASDPANIKVLGDAKIAGWVRDTRVVGDVLYSVTEDYGWYYGWEGGAGANYHAPNVVISSVSFANRQVKRVGERKYDGWSGAFYVSANAVLLAHGVDTSAGYNTGKTEVEYVDIHDPAGAIAPRGKFTVDGSFDGWGTDNGRWNVDLKDDRYARVVTRTCSMPSEQYYSCGQYSTNVSIVDFQNPDMPVKAGSLATVNQGWQVAARFDGNKLYLSPSSYDGTSTTTPIQVYDLSTPTAPVLAGTVTVGGYIWNFTPMGDKIFALGQAYASNYSSSKVTLSYIDVADTHNPHLIGTSAFGDGWAWTPAAQTFKAFGLNQGEGLVVLPFSGWNNTSGGYTNGLQLIEFSPTSITTKGAGRTTGWVERGVFVKNRLVSLSDLALSVIDYTDRMNPRTVSELTLARNVVAAIPSDDKIIQVSTDWWGYDRTKSEVRVLPIANAEEDRTDPAAQTVTIDGSGAQVYRNGNFAYVVSYVNGDTSKGDYASKPQVQVLDMSGGKATLRGKVTLPFDNSYYGWGWGGCYWYDWWDSSSVVQVEGDALAFRRVKYDWDEATQRPKYEQTLYVVDAKNPDAPSVSTAQVTQERDWWWGNVRAVGNQLYTSHYRWVEYPKWENGKQTVQGRVRYYLDRYDLSDRKAPKSTGSINVPGMLVGGNDSDPSQLYFVDYRWQGDRTEDDFSVAKIVGDKAYLQSTMRFDGYVGNLMVRGSKAYTSVVDYASPYDNARVRLHELDLTDPKHPVDRAASPKAGWGWLLGVEGDRALVTSGWGYDGLDIYKLQDGQAPAFDQFTRTRGWWTNGTARQGDNLFLASGYWGVQSIALKK